MRQHATRFNEEEWEAIKQESLRLKMTTSKYIRISLRYVREKEVFKNSEFLENPEVFEKMAKQKIENVKRCIKSGFTRKKAIELLKSDSCLTEKFWEVFIIPYV